MIPIGDAIPNDTAALRAALANALAPLGIAPGAVTIEGELPALARLAVRLDGAKFTRTLRAANAAETTGGCFARDVAATADRVEFEGIAFRASLHAEDAVFDFARSTKGGTAMRLASAKSGMLEVEITRAELERALHILASTAAEKQGAEIKSLKLNLTAETPQTLALQATVTAKAMMFTASVTVTGTLEISATLVARARNLACKGDGMIGNMAAGFLRPKFAEIEARTIPLGHAIAGIALREVRISGGESLRIEARI